MKYLRPVFAIGVVFFGASSAAVASESLSYRCSIGDQFAFVQTIPEEGRAVYEELGTRTDLVPDGRGGYFNDHASISFQADDGQPLVWLGDVSYRCALATGGKGAGQTHAGGAVGGNETRLNAQGRSLGGKLRDGPGTNFRQVGSLSEGAWVTILTNTGVHFDGYDWFEVVADSGQRGYQWGGIMCSNGQHLAGIYQQCGTAVSSETAPSGSKGQSEIWMAFALAPGGAFGHGAAPTRAGAEQFAMNYCGNGQCRIADVTQARCHVLAVSGTSNGIGAGESKQAAGDVAMNWCATSGAPDCRIEYAYCQ